MKICTPDGRTAVLNNNFIHIAPDPVTMDAVSIKLDGDVSLEHLGDVPKQVIYELNRKNARVNLSKDGDSGSPLSHIVLTVNDKKALDDPFNLYVDDDALNRIQSIIPSPMEKSDDHSDIKVQAITDESLSGTSLNLEKKDKSADDESVESRPKPAQTRRVERSYTTHEPNYKGAVANIVAGMMLITMPQLTDVIFEGVLSGVPVVEHVAQNSREAVPSIAANMDNLKASLTSMIQLLGGVFHVVGVAALGLGLYKFSMIYKNS